METIEYKNGNNNKRPDSIKMDSSQIFSESAKLENTKEI